MAVGLHELARQVCDNQPQERERADKRGRHRHVERNGKQKMADAFVVIYAEVYRLVLSERKHIEQAQIFSENERDCNQNDYAEQNQARVRVVKTCDKRGKQCFVGVRVHNALNCGLHASEERCQHRANQNHIQHVASRLFENVAVNQKGNDRHNHKVNGKRNLLVRHQDACRTCKKIDERVHERVERVHAEQAGSYNRVVDDRLEHNRRASD